MTTRLLAGLALLATGCGGPSANRAPSVPSCMSVHPATHPADTLTVFVFDDINLAHAPWGRNREERFVFGHLYETLVNIDCHGKVQPGLAKSFLPASDGWMVELREDAHFWDGSPGTAKDVAACLNPLFQSGIALDRIDVVDETHVLVHMSRRVSFHILAQPVFAIIRQATSRGIPMGTGSWRIDEDTSVDDDVVMSPWIQGIPVVRFVRRSANDARDIIDGPADALISDDPTVIEYAATRSQVAFAPLAYDHAYFLLSPSRALLSASGQYPPPLRLALKDDLALNVVSKDARRCMFFPTRWDCDFEPADFPSRQPTDLLDLQPRMVYRAGDTVARDLAGRLVALAAMDTTSSADARTLRQVVRELKPGVRAYGARNDEFAALLADGRDAAYIISLSPAVDSPCTTLWFADHARWVLKDSRFAACVPLIETRAHFIAISDRIGFIDDGAGSVRIAIPPPGARQ